jgi:hypothetical protein
LVGPKQRLASVRPVTAVWPASAGCSPSRPRLTIAATPSIRSPNTSSRPPPTARPRRKAADSGQLVGGNAVPTSWTIAAFSSADQRRLRCTDVITSTCSIFPVIDTAIPLMLSQGVDPAGVFRGPLHHPIPQITPTGTKSKNRRSVAISSGIGLFTRRVLPGA